MGGSPAKTDPNDVIANWTIVVAIATCCGVLVALLQFLLLRKGSVDTRNAADASASAAKTAELALTRLERPYVLVNIPKAGLHRTANNEVQGGVAQLKIFNIGRSAALLREVIWTPTTIPAGQEPEPLNKDDPRRKAYQYGTFCAQGDPHSESYEVTPGIYGTSVALKKMCTWFIGFVVYDDVLGNQYRTGFAFRFDPDMNRFERAGGSTLNYGSKVSAA